MSKEKIELTKSLKNLFKKLKIEKGANIMIHSNSAGILQFWLSREDKKISYKIFFNLLLNTIGDKGTLVVPTYNYDFAAGKTFVHDAYNSQVGELTNFFLKEYKNQRSLDPIFSHAIIGNLKKTLLNTKTQTCFGNQSIFKKFHDYNFKIFGFCSPLNSMTFLHYIEREMKIKYRYNKNFVSTFIKKGKKKKIKLNYFVGKKSIDYRIKNYKLEKAFKNSSNFLFKNFGNFYCWTINTNDCFEIIKKRILKKNDFLIR